LSATRDLKVFVVAFVIALIVLSAIVALAQIPYPYDEYYTLFTLGSTGMADNYFPGNFTNILPQTTISWYVGVYNHMGSVELVRVVFKLLNSSMPGPVLVNNTASGRPAFYEQTRLLLSNETWILPVSWSIQNATETVNATEIHSMMINGQLELSNESMMVEALHGYNYRILIELWVYSEVLADFTYVWSANGVARSTYNQLWFNMTRISLLPG